MSSKGKGPHILEKICNIRKEKIKKFGFEFGFNIPEKREVPLCPPRFHAPSPFLIAEIKRSSPSAGDISPIDDPIGLAGLYLDSGASAISVLTEEEHFKGSIKDLMNIKNTYKNATILRKDFLQYPEEVIVSFRAGADMILLIIAMFLEDKNTFESILKEARKLEMGVLFEVHNWEEYLFLAPYLDNLDRELLGINARSLHSFEISKQDALILAHKIKDINPNIPIIFESGITSSHDGYIIGTNQINGMLCGSYLVEQNGKNLSALKQAYIKGYKQSQTSFEYHLFRHLALNKRPLIKVCGITNLDDALLCAEAGADMLGFILVPDTPRYIAPTQIKQISKALTSLYPDILKIGVLSDDPQTIKDARNLLDSKILDSLQLHSMKDFSNFGGLNLKESSFSFYPSIDFGDMDCFPDGNILPFVLLDSKYGGGSGKSIETPLLEALKMSNRPLFMAGGIGLENLNVFLDLNPKMLDINSKLESKPGYKDNSKVKKLFEALDLRYGER